MHNESDKKSGWRVMGTDEGPAAARTFTMPSLGLLEARVGPMSGNAVRRVSAPTRPSKPAPLFSQHEYRLQNGKRLGSRNKPASTG